MRPVIAWLDSGGPVDGPLETGPSTVEWRRNLPFLILHLLCLTVFIVGFSWVALGVALALYLLRMFAIAGFYHRYFSHRTFRTSREFQYLMALLGCSAAQRGPLWWASHHRHHHVHSDQPEDLHSPRQRGFWMSHCGWFLTDAGSRTSSKYLRDWLRFPELVALDRFHRVVPLTLIVLLFVAGQGLHHWLPQANTNGLQLVVWGFLLSTVALYHATYSINSVAHRVGSRRYETEDDSRNNGWLALITLGEGWHNNHHRHPGTVRQGFYWWEFDPAYWVLRVLSWVGVVSELRELPATVRESKRRVGVERAPR